MTGVFAISAKDNERYKIYFLVWLRGKYPGKIQITQILMKIRYNNGVIMKADLQNFTMFQ